MSRFRYLAPHVALAAAIGVLFTPSVLAQARGTGGGLGGATSSGSRLQSTGARPQGFSVVLVLGEMQSGSTQDTVPAAARKALGDMKDFLPYKSYRLLDTQWTLCCDRGADASVVSRLRGADDREYELSLTSTGSRRVSPVAGSETSGGISVRFHLREVPDSGTTTPEPASGQDVVAEIEREQQRLEQTLRQATSRATQRHDVGAAGPVDEDREIQQLRTRVGEIRIRLAEARQQQQRKTPTARNVDARDSSGRRSIIDTSFTMDVGETVVVGTSRLKGDKALIALLTAVPANRSSR